MSQRQGPPSSGPSLPQEASIPGTGLQLAFLFFAAEFVAMLLTRYFAQLGDWPRNAFGTMSHWVTAGVQGGILLGVPSLRRWCMDQLRTPLPPRSSPELAAVLVLKAAIPFAVLGGGVLWMLQFAPGEPPPGYRTNDPALAWEVTLMPARILQSVLLSWLMGPLIEELVFRGLLYRAFERQWGWVAGAGISSLLFGLVHPDRIVATGLGGLVLALVLHRTGSLRACILLHASFNLLVSWPLLGQVLLSPRTGDLHSHMTWALPLACLAFVAVALPAYAWIARRPAAVPPAN